MPGRVQHFNPRVEIVHVIAKKINPVNRTVIDPNATEQGHREVPRGPGQDCPRGPLWGHNCKTREAVFYNILYTLLYIIQP
jgi:hypothetical protein